MYVFMRRFFFGLVYVHVIVFASATHEGSVCSGENLQLTRGKCIVSSQQSSGAFEGAQWFSGSVLDLGH